MKTHKIPENDHYSESVAHWHDTRTISLGELAEQGLHVSIDGSKLIVAYEAKAYDEALIGAMQSNGLSLEEVEIALGAVSAHRLGLRFAKALMNS